MALLPGTTVVVFDNNAYGDFALGRTRTQLVEAVAILRDRQASIGHVSLGSPIVLMELLALLSRPSSPAFLAGWNALTALTFHCEITTPTGMTPIGFINSFITTIAVGLFGAAPVNHNRVQQHLADLAKLVALTSPCSVDSESQAAFEDIATHVKSVEEDFVGELFDRMVLGVNPAATDWAPLKDQQAATDAALEFLDSPDAELGFAKMQVAQAMDAIGIPEEPELLEAGAEQLLGQIGVSAALFNGILRRLATTGCDLRKRNRANWVWDMHIAMAVGPFHRVDDKPVLLVTSDQDILTAARDIGHPELATSYSEYCRLVGV